MKIVVALRTANKLVRGPVSVLARLAAILDRLTSAAGKELAARRLTLR